MQARVNECVMKRAIGANIRRARVVRGLSRKALAEAIGANELQIVAYESGSYYVTAARLAVIAAVLQVEAGELLGGCG